MKPTGSGTRESSGAAKSHDFGDLIGSEFPQKSADGPRAGRPTRKTRFLNNSQGPLNEATYYSLILSRDLGYASCSLRSAVDEISRLLNTCVGRIRLDLES